MKKLLVVGIIVLFIGMTISTSIGFNDVEQSYNPTTNGKTFYVGGNGTGNYTRIQDAIDDASDGDTVFVFDDSSPYYENVNIYQMITLVGEDKETTVIDGSGIGNVVQVLANKVSINNFTIQNSGGPYGYAAIFIDKSDFITVSDNILLSNYWCGIFAKYSNNSIISSNNISNNNAYGINLYYSNSNIISENILSYHDFCIRIFLSNNNIISYNNISNNGEGIRIEYSKYNNVSENTISKNQFGIFLAHSTYNNIMRNSIISSSVNRPGITLYNSTKNNITENYMFNTGLQFKKSYQNNIIDNTVNGKTLLYLEKESNKVIDDNNVGQIVIVSCSNITIQNLKLSNTYIGIQFLDCYDCLISDNNISNLHSGIDLYQSDNNNILDNSISNNSEGIGLEYSKYNNVSENTISNNDLGLNLENSNYNTISRNNIEGITLYQSNNNNILDNSISNNDLGVGLAYSNYNIISRNNITDNRVYGIFIMVFSNENKLYLNNLIRNTQNAIDECNNIWDNGSVGNHWDDYKGWDLFPRDGIGDIPYNILGGDNQDNYPLMRPWPEVYNNNQAKDKRGEESDWDYLEVKVPKKRMLHSTFLYRLLERFPILQRLLVALRWDMK